MVFDQPFRGKQPAVDRRADVFDRGAVAAHLFAPLSIVGVHVAHEEVADQRGVVGAHARDEVVDEAGAADAEEHVDEAGHRDPRHEVREVGDGLHRALEGGAGDIVEHQRYRHGHYDACNRFHAGNENRIPEYPQEGGHL